MFLSRSQLLLQTQRDWNRQYEVDITTFLLILIYNYYYYLNNILLFRNPGRVPEKIKVSTKIK